MKNWEHAGTRLKQAVAWRGRRRGVPAQWVARGGTPRGSPIIAGCKVFPSSMDDSLMQEAPERKNAKKAFICLR